MKFPKEAIDRYRKFYAIMLDTSSAPAERTVASKKIGELEQQHPGIGIEATRPETPPPVSSTVTPPSDAFGVGSFFRRAAEAASHIVDSIESSFSKQNTLRRKFKVSSNVTQAGKVTITVTLDPKHLEDLLDLFYDQPDARLFVENWLGNSVAREFREVIDEIAGDEL